MIHIHADRTDYNLSVNVQIYRDNESVKGQPQLDFASVMPDGRLKFEMIKSEVGGYIDCSKVPTLFKCDEFTFREIVQAFLDFAKKEKIESKSESFCEGKLVATEKHLEDMRKIVFFKPEYKEPEK